MPTFKEFQAHIKKHGVARTNRFQVLIPVPERLLPTAQEAEEEPQSNSIFAKAVRETVRVIQIFTGSSTTEMTRGLDLMCFHTEMPAKNLNISETKYNGDVHRVGHSILYGQQQFSFKVSGDMYEKNIIDAWMNLVVDPVTHEVAYQSDYVTNITINQLDEKDQIIYSIVLNDAFPVVSNPLTLSNAESNNSHELMVLFAYKNWLPADIQKPSNEATSLMQTPLGPYLAPILSNPAVQRGLEYIENTTGLDLEGEALNIYNQVDDIVRATTGSSVNKSVGLLNSIMAAIQSNNTISGSQAAKLMDFIAGIVEKMAPDLINE